MHRKPPFFTKSDALVLKTIVYVHVDNERICREFLPNQLLHKLKRRVNASRQNSVHQMDRRWNSRIHARMLIQLAEQVPKVVSVYNIGLNVVLFKAVQLQTTKSFVQLCS